jgi:hypothetical protein
MSTQPIRSADLMKYKILGSPTLLQQLQTDPKGTLETVAEEVTKTLPPPAYITDQWTYRIVVIALGIVVISAMIGGVYLAVNGKTIPDVLTALGAAAIGALAGLLTPLPSRS